MIPRWVERYQAIPYRAGGRDLGGCDCWGLVRLVLEHECGIVVPLYGEVPARDLLTIDAQLDGRVTLPPWRPVAGAVIPFDVALLRGRPFHVGIAVAADRILHSDDGCDSVCVPLAHPTIAHRLRGFYRHQDVA